VIRRLLLAVVAVAFCVAPVAAQTRSVTLLPSTTLAAAVTARAEDFAYVPREAVSLTVEAIFVRAGGGTTAKAWVQTSFDGGTTWVDVMNFAFTTTTGSAVSSVRVTTAVAANYTPTDGTLADNTIKDGLLGDRVRVKWTTTGTYTGASSIKLVGVFQ
jgi:hypothetical protein